MLPLRIAGVDFSLEAEGEDLSVLQRRYRRFVAARPEPRARRVTRLSSDLRTFDAALRESLAAELLPRQGLLIHGAAVARKARGLLFFGPSGVGKSTVAAVVGAEALADELSGVRRLPDGGFALFGTPFWEGDDREVPLRALLSLEQAECDEAVPLAPSDLVRALLPQTAFPGGAAAERVLEVIVSLAESVPAYRLRFRRGDGFLRVIDGL
jgi:hypothetical protein